MKTCSTCTRRKECIDYQLNLAVGMGNAVCEFYAEEEVEKSSILFIIVAYFKGEKEPVVFENITNFTVNKEMEAYILSECSGCEIVINAREINYLRKEVGDIFYEGSERNPQ